MIYHGVVRAVAIWFPPETRDVPARVLELWQPGSRLVEGLGQVLCWSQPRWIDCSQCPGLPLTEFPVPLLWNGVVHEDTRWKPLDPGAWVELEPVGVGQALAEPTLHPVVEMVPPFDAREQFHVPPPSPERQAFQAPSPPRNWLGRLLDRFASSANQRFLRKMVRLFETGDWDQALRHGISVAELPKDPSLAPAGRLAPREKLELQAPAAAASSIGIGKDNRAYLTTLYQRAARQLTEAGRIDEAAFVLAELLGDRWGATRLLEQHGRGAEAAQLAEHMREWAEAIRLWLNAGEKARALTLARRFGAWSQVHARLCSGEPERARAWLWEWAEWLAGSGREAAAVGLVWPNREHRSRARSWLARAVAAGGADAGRIAALMLADPLASEHEALRVTVRHFAEQGGPEFKALLEGMAAMEHPTRPDLVRPLAAECLRAALLQVGTGQLTFSRALAKRLAALSGDALLQADLPLWTQTPPVGRWDLSVDETGATPLSDAVLLPDGRMLVALGAAGLLVLSASGGRSALLPVPTDHIVQARAGQLTLLLHRRGPDWSVTRLDAATLKTRPWVDTRLEHWLDHHDGDSWLVVCDGALHQIDLHAEGWRSHCKIPLAHKLLKMTLGASSLGLLLQSADRQLWAEFYSYPDLQLRERRALQTDNLYWVTLLSDRAVEEPPWSDEGASVLGCLLPIDGLEGEIRCHGRWVVVTMDCWFFGRGTVVYVLDTTPKAARIVLRLVTPERIGPRPRVLGDVLVYCDSAGRLLALDLERRTELRRFLM
jgi:hypothetical protein